MPSRIGLDLQAAEWIAKSRDDELNAASILRHRDGAPSGVCFLAQQMSEKLLKAFLVQERGNYPKIHSLPKLTELCIVINENFKELEEDVVFLDVFYNPSRYPVAFCSFSWREAEKAMVAANKIKEFILEKIKLS